ncbi:BAQ_1a_G0036070.mRNA.1.CDS.1 [Saccharomyces cerevisiae]|nr:BAQ_1a_G0036070.mRNA.1.CDS.1 [Saccharomyces cerevisiae]CAI4643615.1 BAM_G0036080.mRNA.1.CDS.1 [Saccharomyces cerevisiae]CAI7228491.1 BAM_G0036080.mRNA.1.CDS.1 [Saccharomyces cerevisiae]CAI7229441.1 BAQ_1a_G0036070.mRNA.1.CDS.1 [Saccharomyces cerevisiae]
MSNNKIKRKDASPEQEAIESFTSLTKCDPKVSRKYLQRNHWNINYALNDYYDKVIGTFTDEVSTVAHPPVYPKELTQVFEHYSNNSLFDIDSLVKFIEELGYNLEDLATLCLVHLLGYKKLEEPLKREDFLSTWSMQGCSTISDMQECIKTLDVKLHEDLQYFTQIYNYAFNLILDPNRKDIDTDEGIQYWKLFFQPEYPVRMEPDLLEAWFRFLRDEGKTTISKDTWRMLLLFFKRYPTIQKIISDYDETAAWPFIIDEFYEYLQDQQ